jgi:hypothetical protein
VAPGMPSSRDSFRRNRVAPMAINFNTIADGTVES